MAKSKIVDAARRLPPVWRAFRVTNVKRMVRVGWHKVDGLLVMTCVSCDACGTNWALRLWKV